MGNSSSEQQLSQALHGQYQVESLSYLLHKRTKQPCTLHKITTNTELEANLVKQVIEEYGKTRCQSISQLRDHFNVDNTGYCSNEQNFYLIFQGKNNLTLKDQYLSRKANQTPFKQHEVQQIVDTYLCGLRQYSQRFKRNFDKLTLDSIGVDQKTRKIVLTDAYLCNNSTINHSDTYSQFITSYPSPQKLSVAYNSKTDNYDEFQSNLFSVGVISLQILSLNVIDNIYLKKKQINYEQVNNRIKMIRDDKLRQGVQYLLHINPNERKKIYQLWGIQNEEQHFLQTTISPLSTEREMIQIHNKIIQKTYPKTIQTTNIRRLTPQQNRQVTIMHNQHHQHNIIERTNSHIDRRYSPPLNNFNNQKPIQNISIQQPSKNRTSSVVNPSTIKISFADSTSRTEITPRQSTNIPPTLTPYVGLTNILNEGSRKESLVATREDTPYNPYSFYTNSANSSLNEVNRSQNLQFRQENPPPKVISPPRQRQQISPRRQHPPKPIEKEISPINYTFSSTNKHNSPASQKNSKPIQKNSQTPTRPTNKYKHNSTIVQVQDEDSVDRTFKSDDKAELQYVAEEYETGSRYQGYKSNGMRNGLGKFYYQDGGYYQGRWKNNRMEGYGKLYYNGGKLAYQGNWVEDQFSGAGKVYNDNPSKLNGAFDYTNFDLLQDYWEYYQGHLSRDTKEGRGKIKLSNGEIFEGDFHNDRIQGLGKFYNYEGKVIEGIWKQSKLLKIITNG